jgi:hypothetical protein
VSCLAEKGTPKIPLDRLHDELAYSVEGIFDLAFLGPLDLPDDATQREELADWCVLVERLPSGDSARCAILDPLDAADAVRLGVSVGVMVERAANAGVLLTALRPDYIWVDRDAAGHLHATGLTARNGRFFESHKWGESPSLPPFLRPYGAPESMTDPSERCLVFTLATLIAEWTTGRYPFRDARYRGFYYVQVYVDKPHDPDLRSIPSALAAVLERGLCPDPQRRPPLSSWLRTLKRVRV